ncbi:hypothetical protein S100072_03235 [Bacillus velezensis]|nr:hypothetical protein S100072_03235 [Bacillus velezensis]ASB66969.1 hypothetical protein S101413_03552 [Bacillus velezensis]
MNTEKLIQWMSQGHKVSEEKEERGVNEKRRDLIMKARSFHVPGYGPDFEKMTNDQIEKHINFIEKTFEMAFDEDDEDL